MRCLRRQAFGLLWFLLRVTPANPFVMSLVVPSTNMVQDFECAICNNLVEEPTVTTCTHVFCRRKFSHILFTATFHS